MAGAADDRDTAYADGYAVSSMYDDLQAELRTTRGAVSAGEVFEVAYMATVMGWDVARAMTRLEHKERV
jgi:hypothetical protein